MAIELVIGPASHLQSECLAKRYTADFAGGRALLIIDYHLIEGVVAGALVFPGDVQFPCLRTHALMAVDEAFDSVYLHNAHLFPDLKEFVLRQHDLRRNCFIYAMDSDHHQEKIGQVWDLIPYAHSITKPLRICMNPSCLKSATCTMQLGERLIVVCHQCLLAAAP